MSTTGKAKRNRMLLVGDYHSGDKNVLIQLKNKTILCNLEGPVLSEQGLMIKNEKVGPSISSKLLPDNENTYLFSLANNHMMDYGFEGVKKTIEYITNKGFGCGGCAENIESSRKPMFFEEANELIAIISCCEAQFGVSTNFKPGVAEIGPWIYEEIFRLKTITNNIIISVHAGIEDSAWPYPYLRDLYKSFIDTGAKVIHGHHSHIPQGFEVYKDGLILYGLGNFVVDPTNWSNYKNGLWSYGVEIEFTRNSFNWKINFFDISFNEMEDCIMVVPSLDKPDIFKNSYLEKCNAPFSDKLLFEQIWQDVAWRTFNKFGAEYMNFRDICLNGDVQNIMRQSLSFVKKAISGKPAVIFRPTKFHYMLWYHMLSCESHRQMLTKALALHFEEELDIRSHESMRLVDEMFN